MADERFIWAAGMFEVSGTATVTDGRVRLALTSTNHQRIARFHQAIRTGKLYGPYGNGPGRKPYYIWLVEGADALRLADALYRWMGSTQRERIDALRRFHEAKAAA